MAYKSLERERRVSRKIEEGELGGKTLRACRASSTFTFAWLYGGRDLAFEIDRLAFR